MDKPILLPAGKKPIMITETLTNYFNYMIDGNGDNVADAQGDGFASRTMRPWANDFFFFSSCTSAMSPGAP